MKKILIGFLAFSMLAVVSCKKSTTVNGGSFTFKSTNYSVSSAIGNTTTDNTVVAVSQPSNQYDELLFTFYSNIVGGAQVVPYPRAGSYTVVSGAPDTSGTQIQLYLKLTTGSTYAAKTYIPDPSTPVIATVTAASGLNSVLKISLPSVDMVNINDSTDHGTLTANVMQTGVTQ